MLFEAYNETKEAAETALEPTGEYQGEDDDDEDESHDVDTVLANSMKSAFEAVIDSDDYTPNDIADLISTMTDALEEIAPDVFEDGDDDDDYDEDDDDDESLDDDEDE